MRARWMMLVGIWGGCDSEVAPASHELLCPSCIPRSGGESSDFGGGDGCEFEEQTLSVGPELQALEATLAAYAGAFERKLRWSAPNSATAITAEETTIRGNIQLANTYLVGASVDCRHLVRVEASVVLEAANGSMRATGGGVLTFDRANGTSSIAVASDLSTVRGNLDLQLDGSQAHVGQLSTNIFTNTQGVWGAFTIDVSYFADRETAESYARGDTLVQSTSKFQVTGAFSAE